MGFIFIICLILSSHVYAQSTLPYKVEGRLKVLSSSEIEDSRWSIGGETLDRDYADYDSYRSYLGLSGAKRIRLQAGWAKCEKIKGEYNFSWLDNIIDDAISRSVKPWLQVSYGNPIYEGGGQPFLAGGLPVSEEALSAWDRWIVELAMRYKDRVDEWEIWNEPDINKDITPEEFAEFYERTVKLIKNTQPKSKIIAMGLASPSRKEFVLTLLERLSRNGNLQMIDAISYHGYFFVPEEVYPHVLSLRKLIDQYNPEIELWQGENGAPSTKIGIAVGAMTRQDWSEVTQAKWNIRRMIGDMGHDVAVTNIFTISDLWYGTDDHLKGLNSKGLLKARPDLSIERPKASYYAYQNGATLFSGEVDRIKSISIDEPIDNLMLFAFRKKSLNATAVAFWFADLKPVEEMIYKEIDLSLSGIQMKRPVLVDLYSGLIYKIPRKNIVKKREKVIIKSIKAGDYPLVLVDRKWLEIERINN